MGKKHTTSAAGEVGAVRLSIKVVPGAKRDEIAGMLGERLKVRVAAPPEGGRANEAVCRVIAGALGIKAGAVTIVSGHSAAEKVVEIVGVSAERVREMMV